MCDDIFILSLTSAHFDVGTFWFHIPILLYSNFSIIFHYITIIYYNTHQQNFRAMSLDWLFLRTYSDGLLKFFIKSVINLFALYSSGTPNISIRAASHKS